MYNAFFGLERSPFELSPDPRFFFPAAETKETLASIYYSLCRRKGCVVITGEVGTGKTLLIRCLLQLLKRQQVPFANVVNPRLSDIDFLSYVSSDLGINVKEGSKASLLRGLYNFMLAQMQKGLTTVLVVDEAHQASFAMLEEIRLLTNLETSEHKLIQVVLVGQPELDTKLDSFELRQLKQRVTMRCRLEPYTIVETRSYVEQRLRQAGAGDKATEIFPLETIEAIQRHSLGIPRLINNICDHCMVCAYARQLSSVPVWMVDVVASYFRVEEAPKPFDKSQGLQFMDEREAAKYLLQTLESLKSKLAPDPVRAFSRTKAELHINSHSKATPTFP